jgi:hypothetical protein
MRLPLNRGMAEFCRRRERHFACFTGYRRLTDEQYASFEAGNLYVNVHSAEHKPGEIRAQLNP